MKTIVITGSTKGIGKAIAERFAKEGFSLGICSRNNQELQSQAKELLALGAEKVFYEQCDVANKGDVALFCEHVQEEFDSLDVLVHNAGFFQPGYLLSEPEEHFEQMMQTNLYSAYYMTKGLISLVKKSSSGHIFNMCSTASIKAYQNGGAYCVSKFALLGFNKMIRAELLEHSIKVTAVLPGPTFTSSWEGAGIEKERFIQPEEVSESIFSAYNLTGNAVVEELIIRPQLGDI